jgi:hypothetical protein
MVGISGYCPCHWTQGSRIQTQQGMGNGFLRVIKIYSTTSFGGQVQPSVPCSKILQHVKDPYSMKEIHHRQNSREFFAKFILLHY